MKFRTLKKNSNPFVNYTLFRAVICTQRHPHNIMNLKFLLLPINVSHAWLTRNNVPVSHQAQQKTFLAARFLI